MEVPGLVDLQVNGYKGVDFSSPELTEDDFAHACRQMLNEGATAFLPTVITSSEDTYRHNLPVIARVIRDEQFRGRVFGLHLEGPFISAEDGVRGAHNAEWVRRPDIEFFNQLMDWADGRVRLLTIATELEGADKVCAKAGIGRKTGHQKPCYYRNFHKNFLKNEIFLIVQGNFGKLPMPYRENCAI